MIRNWDTPLSIHERFNIYFGQWPPEKSAMLKRGTQIIYVPTHANGDTSHPDCEPGFVTSVYTSTAFCRYWSKCHPGELRTKVNSESTRIDDLVIQDTVPQARVEAVLIRWCFR